MAQKTCPVCEVRQDDASTQCSECGWDFPVYIDSPDDAAENLKQARRIWKNKPVTLLQNRITSLGQELEQAKRAIQYLQRKLSEKSQIMQPKQESGQYTKLGYGGVELSEDATQDQGWLMTRDNETNLVWESKTSANKDVRYNWSESQKVFIAELNKQRFGGFNDWRLPERDELQTLIKQGESPTIDTCFFPNTEESFYWSGTTHSNNTNLAWYTSFYYGHTHYTHKSYSDSVRAVRADKR